MAIKLYKCLGSFRMPEAIILVYWSCSAYVPSTIALSSSSSQSWDRCVDAIGKGRGRSYAPGYSARRWRTNESRKGFAMQVWCCNTCWCHGGGNQGHGRGQAVLPALWLIMTRPPPTPKKITRKLRPQQQPADSSRLLLKLVHERNHTMRRFH